MKLRVLLVDDEPLALERLGVAFQGIDAAEIVGTARDGEEALERTAELSPDLVILDVQMPGLNGMAVAAALPADPRPEIIFVTAFEQYAPDAFDVEAADYLLKPVRFDRLRIAIERAVRRRTLRDAHGRVEALEQEVARARSDGSPQAASDFHREMWVPSKHGLVRIDVDTIDWIEAARDYVLLHTPTRSHILRATMGGLEEKLDPAVLGRVHRSAFVRWRSVEEVQRPGKGLFNLVLRDGTVVQVGPSYIDTVTGALQIAG